MSTEIFVDRRLVHCIGDIKFSNASEAPLVDVVWRWVNPNSDISKIETKQLEKSMRRRFRDNDELRFSMRSFSRVAGVRNLHIVGKGDPPRWLVPNHNRARFWNETSLLQQLILERGLGDIRLKVTNSEPAKLAIARVPGLAERIIISDGDYFLIPPRAGPILSTRIFFDEAGIPLHTSDVFMSHRPIPMLRDAYMHAINSEPDSSLRAILVSGSARKSIDRFKNDMFPKWCAAMWRNGTARPVKFPDPHAVPGIARSRKQCRSAASAAFRLHWHTGLFNASTSVDFFDEVRCLRPYVLCVNDDWPLAPDEYERTIAAFHLFVREIYPGAESWEKVAKTGGEAGDATAVEAVEAAAGQQAVQRRHQRVARAARRLEVRQSTLSDGDKSHDSQLVSCNASGHHLRLPSSALLVPPVLDRLRQQVSAPCRQELRDNPRHLTPEQLTASVIHLDDVDVDNTISSTRGGLPDVLTLAELNLERGRYWCEFAQQIRRTAALNAVDVWLLNEADLGMARSDQAHTARLLAHALGFNYAWGAEFVELTAGNKLEQRRVGALTDRDGLHGNAVLSRWPLWNVSIVRMPGMAPLYTSIGRETAYGFEKRLGGRMTLLGLTGVPGQAEIVVGATHAQTSWRRHSAHTQAASALIRSRIDLLSASDGGGIGAKGTSSLGGGMHPVRRPVLLGGDTWPETCSWLGIDRLVMTSAPTNIVGTDHKVRLFGRGNDDYICGQGVTLVGGAATYLPAIGLENQGSNPHEFVISDHVFVTAKVRWSNTSTYTEILRTSPSAAVRAKPSRQLLDETSTTAQASCNRSYYDRRRHAHHIEDSPPQPTGPNILLKAAAFRLAHNKPKSFYKVYLMKETYPLMRWPSGIPKHIHMTAPDVRCESPMDRYCEFMGGDPNEFLRRMWITSGLNPEFELTVHTDSDCDLFLRQFSNSSRHWNDAHKLWSSIPNGVIKSDFWRMAFLLARGGVYSDIDVEPVSSLRSFVRPDDVFVTSGSLYPAQTNFHVIVARPGEPALARALLTLMHTIRRTKYSYWTWSGCKPLFEGLLRVRNDSLANPTSIGEGFSTSQGFYRILTEHRVASWRGVRKATCERLRTSESNQSKEAQGHRLLLLNKYLAIPGAVVANATRSAHWGWSLNLWSGQTQRGTSSGSFILHPMATSR